MERQTVTLFIIVGCIIMSAYFSATETAFSSLSRIRIKNMAEKGNERAKLVLRLSENYDGLLSTILIGNNIVNIACASLATILFVRLLGDEAGASASTVVTTIVVLIFGEVSPKSIAKESPERFAMFSAPLLNGFMVLLTPANFLFRQWKKLLSILFKPSASTGITEEELLAIVEEVEQDAEPEEIAELFETSGFSRLPVYKDTMDDVVGIIYQKDFYSHVYRNAEPVESVIRPVLFVTEGKKIGFLLKELQKSKRHIAVVVDEFGGTVGIVTLEDILEELVGEIWDEHDVEVKEIEKTGAGEYLVSGNANIEKLFEELGRKGETDSSTVSGWLMELAGQIPAEGDRFIWQDYTVSVVRMNRRRVELVRIVPKQAVECNVG